MAVIISQVGLVTPFGRGVQPFVDGMKNGDVVLAEHSPLSHMESALAGLCPNKAFRQYLKRRKAAKLMTPAARLAMDAVGQIWDKVGERLDPVETGLFFSVGREPPDEGDAEACLIASTVDGQFSESALATTGRSLYPPLLPLKTLPNLILGHLSIHFGLCGENAAWAGEGVQSFVEGVLAIEEGRADCVLVGAADSLVDLGQARDCKRMGIEHAPSECAVAWLLEKKSESGVENSAIGRVSWCGYPSLSQPMSQPMSQTGSDQSALSEHQTLRAQMGYCGVAESQLTLLHALLNGEQCHWHGLMVDFKQ